MVSQEASLASAWRVGVWVKKYNREAPEKPRTEICKMLSTCGSHVGVPQQKCPYTLPHPLAFLWPGYRGALLYKCQSHWIQFLLWTRTGGDCFIHPHVLAQQAALALLRSLLDASSPGSACRREVTGSIEETSGPRTMQTSLSLLPPSHMALKQIDSALGASAPS